MFNFVIGYSQSFVCFYSLQAICNTHSCWDSPHLCGCGDLCGLRESQKVWNWSIAIAATDCFQMDVNGLWMKWGKWEFDWLISLSVVLYEFPEFCSILSIHPSIHPIFQCSDHKYVFIYFSIYVIPHPSSPIGWHANMSFSYFLSLLGSSRLLTCCHINITNIQITLFNIQQADSGSRRFTAHWARALPWAKCRFIMAALLLSNGCHHGAWAHTLRKTYYFYHVCIFKNVKCSEVGTFITLLTLA